jgi:hypothetical protein
MTSLDELQIALPFFFTATGKIDQMNHIWQL